MGESAAASSHSSHSYWHGGFSKRPKTGLLGSKAAMQAGSVHRVQAMLLKQYLAQRVVGKRYEDGVRSDRYAPLLRLGIEQGRYWLVGLMLGCYGWMA